MRYDYIGVPHRVKHDATRRHEEYGADPTNARANAGAIVLYQHEEQSLMKAVEGLKALLCGTKGILDGEPLNTLTTDWAAHHTTKVRLTA